MKKYALLKLVMTVTMTMPIGLLKIITIPAFAEEKSTPVEFTVIDPLWKPHDLPKSKYVIHDAAEKQIDLMPRERDSLFARAGISSELTGWDQLDKNMLIARASYKSISELEKLYPKIPPQKLKTLIQLAKEANAGERI